MMFLKFSLLVSFVGYVFCSSPVLVEEGWRQHGIPVVRLSDHCVRDFTLTHTRLSERVKLGCVIGAGKIDKDGKQAREGGEFRLGSGKCYVAASLSLVFEKKDGNWFDEEISITDRLALKPEESRASNNDGFSLVFVSGGFHKDNIPQGDEGDVIVNDSGSSIRIFPPFNPAIGKHEPLPVFRLSLRLCSTDMENTAALKQRVEKDVSRRWLDTNRSFLNTSSLSSSFQRIQNVHQPTNLKIQKINGLIKQMKREREGEDETFLVGSLAALEKDTSFLNNEESNNYLCAEQCLFDFFRHPNVKANIQNMIEAKKRLLNGNLRFAVVNVCSRLSPCHHCSTSFVREMEELGSIRTMLDGILDAGGIKLLVSCQIPYTGRVSIQYNQLVNGTCKREITKEGDAFVLPYNASFSYFPYPVVLMKDGKADPNARFPN